MKFSIVVASLLASQASAFTVSQPSAASSCCTKLNLFGGGDKDDKKGPGMMDQLAMFKKAQEMATKKKELDEELKKMDFQGTGGDGKVTANFKYVPVSNPMDPNPEYEATSFKFDDAFFESASPEDLSAAVKEAVFNAIEETNKAVGEKYSVLQADLMEAFGGMKKAE